MFEQLLIVAGRWNVSKYARTKWSAAAFDALYGVRGRYGESSLNVSSESSGRSPYTSHVETWWKRSTPWRRAASSSSCVPTTFVRAKRPGIEHGEAVVRLGGEVDDDVDLVLGERARREVEVGDVALDERHVVGHVLAHARVREQVVGDDVILRVALAPVADEVRADEPGGAGDEHAHAARV